MTGDCKHISERLLGKPQTGACYVCCPWMFPNGSSEARRAFEQWHTDHGIRLSAAWRKREERWALAEMPR